MFLKLGSKGRNDFPYYLLSLGLVIAFFAIVGYLPISLTLSNLEDKGVVLQDISELQVYLGLNSFFVLLLIPFIAGILCLIFCVKWIHGRDVISLFTSRDVFDWKRFFFSFIIWGVVMAIFFLASYFSGYPIFWNFNPSTFIGLVAISIFILPIQTTFEEVFFRGFLFQWFGLIFKRGWITVFIIGILFGLMHGSNPEVEKIGLILLVFYIFNGFFLGIIALMDDGLELTMGYHAVNNIFAALIVTNDWQAFHTDALFLDKTPPEFGVENILTLVIIQPLLLLIFSKKYKWTNWKKRLFSSDVL